MVAAAGTARKNNADYIASSYGADADFLQQRTSPADSCCCTRAKTGDEAPVPTAWRYSMQFDVWSCDATMTLISTLDSMDASCDCNVFDAVLEDKEWAAHAYDTTRRCHCIIYRKTILPAPLSRQMMMLQRALHGQPANTSHRSAAPVPCMP